MFTLEVIRCDIAMRDQTIWMTFVDSSCYGQNKHWKGKFFLNFQACDSIDNQWECRTLFTDINTLEAYQGNQRPKHPQETTAITLKLTADFVLHHLAWNQVKEWPRYSHCRQEQGAGTNVVGFFLNYGYMSIIAYYMMRQTKKYEHILNSILWILWLFSVCLSSILKRQTLKVYVTPS